MRRMDCTDGPGLVLGLPLSWAVMHWYLQTHLEWVWKKLVSQEKSGVKIRRGHTAGPTRKTDVPHHPHSRLNFCHYRLKISYFYIFIYFSSVHTILLSLNPVPSAALLPTCISLLPSVWLPSLCSPLRSSFWQPGPLYMPLPGMLYPETPPLFLQILTNISPPEWSLHHAYTRWRVHSFINSLMSTCSIPVLWSVEDRVGKQMEQASSLMKLIFFHAPGSWAY